MSSTMNTGRTGVSDDLDQQLAGLLSHLGSQSGVDHAAMAIERLDQSTRWLGAVGTAGPDGAPMRVDTPYWIASVTKLYIAASVFRLVERGEVSLETPITSLLPDSMTTGIHRLSGIDNADMITVQHLLGHSSGIPDYLEESPKGEQALLDKAGAQDISWSTDDALQIVRQTLTPHFPPQRLDSGRPRIRYSDTNYQLLIEIIESVRGQSLSEVFADDFYRPLGLTDTSHPEERDQTLPAAIPRFGSKTFDRPKAMRSFRDLVSTLTDQSTFMRALVSGQVFDKPVTLYQMMGNWKSFPFSLNPMPTSPGWPIQYGLGAMRFKIPRLMTPIKPVPAIMGHTGVSGSWLFYCPELNLVLAGTVDQFEAAALPFRFIPRLLRTLSKGLDR